MALAAGMLTVDGSGESVLMKCGTQGINESFSTARSWSWSTTVDDEDGGLDGAGTGLAVIASTWPSVTRRLLGEVGMERSCVLR
jgi:hypothetical protein